MTVFRISCVRHGERRRARHAKPSPRRIVLTTVGAGRHNESVRRGDPALANRKLLSSRSPAHQSTAQRLCTTAQAALPCGRSWPKPVTDQDQQTLSKQASGSWRPPAPNAQTGQICAVRLMPSIEPLLIPNGGYRVLHEPRSCHSNGARLPPPERGCRLLRPAERDSEHGLRPPVRQAGRRIRQFPGCGRGLRTSLHATSETGTDLNSLLVASA